jgi:cystathionine beta-lyase
MNVLSMHGLIGAYSETGAEWTDELCQVLNENIEYAYNFIQNNWPEITLSKPQGTYMLYLDLSEWCKNHEQSIEEVIRAGISKGVIWQDGRPFNCSDTIRMNLALPYDLVVEAFDRLKKYVFV